MRLIDQVVQARSTIDIEDEVGLARLKGAGAWAATLTECPLRFVLEAGAADRCRELLLTDADMLCGENALMRVPSLQLWLEWRAELVGAGGALTGLLVSADETGRKGWIETFWEQADGDPLWAQITVEFDFDADLLSRDDCDAFGLAIGSHPSAPHFLFHPQEQWIPWLASGSEEDAVRAVKQIVADLMPGVELLFAFSVLLGERRVLAQREVDLCRLNKHRVRRGKAALLDHVEVGLSMAGPLATGMRRTGSERAPARLHYVRGHMVSREGVSFWRRSHLRGDLANPIKSRTVTISSG